MINSYFSFISKENIFIVFVIPVYLVWYIKIYPLDEDNIDNAPITYDSKKIIETLENWCNMIDDRTQAYVCVNAKGYGEVPVSERLCDRQLKKEINETIEKLKNMPKDFIILFDDK